MDKRDEGTPSIDRNRLTQEKLERLREKRKAMSETLRTLELRLNEAKDRFDDCLMYCRSLDREIDGLEQGQLPLEEKTNGH